MCVVGATTATRATRPSASIRCATCSPNVVLPAAGVADARNASEEWENTAAAAACCHSRSGRPAGQDGGLKRARSFLYGGGTAKRRRRLASGSDGPGAYRSDDGKCRDKGEAVIGALILALVPIDIFSGMSGPSSWAVSILLGLVGAFVGYLIFTRLLGIGDDDAFDLGGILSAIIGVVIVLLLVGAVVKRTGGTRRPVT